MGAGFGRAPHADVVHHYVARRDGEAKLLHVTEEESKGWAGITKHLHIIRSIRVPFSPWGIILIHQRRILAI